MVDSDSYVNFLGFYEEHQTFNKFIAAISLSKKDMLRITCRLFLSAQAVCLHSACHVHTLIKQCNAIIEACIETPPGSFLYICSLMSKISQLKIGL